MKEGWTFMMTPNGLPDYLPDGLPDGLPDDLPDGLNNDDLLPDGLLSEGASLSASLTWLCDVFMDWPSSTTNVQQC